MDSIYGTGFWSACRASFCLILIFFCFFSAYAQKYPSVSYHIILTGAALTGAESAELQEVLEETNVRVAVVQ